MRDLKRRHWEASLGGPARKWKLPESIGPKTGFTFQTDDALYIDNRGMIFFLAATVYDLDTACLIRDIPIPGLDSYNQKMHRNGDGSVDIYFGPKAPSGQEENGFPLRRTSHGSPCSGSTVRKNHYSRRRGSCLISRGSRTAISGTAIQVLYDIEFRSTPKLSYRPMRPRRTGSFQ
jgi:hypothetical protein